MKEFIKEWVSEGLDYFEVQDKLVARIPLGEGSEINELMSYANELIDMKRVKQVGSTTEEIGEYYTELVGHDWFYEYSDDHRVWRQGSDKQDYLSRKKYLSVDFYRMYTEYSKYIKGGRERPELMEFISP